MKINIEMENHYVVEAHRNGELLWVDEYDNIVVDVGCNDVLDKYFKGSTYTAAHYVGLIAESPTIVAGDTMASHSGWTEVTAYSEGARQTLTMGTVAAKSASNTLSKAVFTINSDSTVVAGAFVATNSTKGGTTGTLYGAGTFTAPRTLQSGDTLSVTVTATAAAA